MSILSTGLLAFLGCAVHFGTVPANGPWGLAEVRAPVAEPGISDGIRAEVLRALAARSALDAPSGRARSLTLTVLEASWVPTRRSPDVLLYEARLTVLFEGEAGGGRVSSTRRGARTVIDPGVAGDARALREAAFAVLAREVAADGVGWLLSTSP